MAAETRRDEWGVQVGLDLSRGTAAGENGLFNLVGCPADQLGEGGRREVDLWCDSWSHRVISILTTISFDEDLFHCKFSVVSIRAGEEGEQQALRVCKPCTSSDVEGDAVPDYFWLGLQDSQGGENMIWGINNVSLHFDVVEYLEIEGEAKPYKNLKDPQVLPSQTMLFCPHTEQSLTTCEPPGNNLISNIAFQLFAQTWHDTTVHTSSPAALLEACPV